MMPNFNAVQERFDRCLIGITHPIGIPTVLDIIDPQYGENYVVCRCTYLIEPNHGALIINIVTKREFRRQKYATFAINTLMNNHMSIRTSTDSVDGERLLETMGFVQDEKVKGQWVWKPICIEENHPPEQDEEHNA